MKAFLIIGNMNAVKYKEVFPLIKAGEVRLGVCNRIRAFVTHEGTLQPFGNTYWFTTLTHDHINPPLTLTATYTPEAYPRYDNYDAIEVSRTKDIPCDYYGVMGVPISFLDKYCPEQFEILGITQRADDPYKLKRYDASEYHNANDLNCRAVIIANGKPKAIFPRILIKRK